MHLFALSLETLFLFSHNLFFLFSYNFFVEETTLLGGMSVWEYGRELRIKAVRAGQGRMGVVVMARQQGQPSVGRGQDAGAHPRQGGKSELLMVARPSDPDEALQPRGQKEGGRMA